MILLDNTVLSNFALVKQVSLLKDFCGDKGATTADVLNELEYGIKDKIIPETELNWLMKLDLNEKEDAMFLNFSKKLGKGEASCLAIAINRGYSFLSDDMAVRKIALREGVKLSGSSGTLQVLNLLIQVTVRGMILLQ